MTFKVISPHGSGAMSTEHWSCVPGHNDLLCMSKAGFTFKMDGKKVKPSEIERRRAQDAEG